MKNLLLLSICFIITNSFMYWEDISSEEQIKFLQSRTIYKNAYDFYNGNLVISDNKQSVILLDSLSNLSDNIMIKSLYFYLFNQVCQKSDASLNEMLGNYCQKIILSDIEYVLHYLKQNKSLSKKYALLLGTEFYFKEDGISEMLYSYNDFKDIINKKVFCQKKYKEFLADFYIDIQRVIYNMK